MANMHVFWSLRESVLTFQVRFRTAGYLASKIVPVSNALLLTKLFLG